MTSPDATGPLLQVRWHPREAPLSPIAIAAVGSCASRLRERLLADPEHLRNLRGVAGTDVLIALASDAQALPWVDGAIYLGTDTAAPEFLWPTAVAPACGARVFGAALARTVDPNALAPWALVLEHHRLVSVRAAASIDLAALEAWRPAT